MRGEGQEEEEEEEGAQEGEEPSLGELVTRLGYHEKVAGHHRLVRRALLWQLNSEHHQLRRKVSMGSCESWQNVLYLRVDGEHFGLEC